MVKHPDAKFYLIILSQPSLPCCVFKPHPPGFGVSSILLPFPQHPIMLRNDGITDKAQGSKCLDRFMGFNESGGQHLTQPLSCVEGI